jgi:hypothetical protein
MPPTRRITTLALLDDQVNVLYTTFDQVGDIGTYQIVPVMLAVCDSGGAADCGGEGAASGGAAGLGADDDSGCSVTRAEETRFGGWGAATLVGTLVALASVARRQWRREQHH